MQEGKLVAQSVMTWLRDKVADPINGTGIARGEKKGASTWGGRISMKP